MPQKAILFVENPPSHPGKQTLVCGEIKVKFLPPNVTPLFKPMDQGVLENIKCVYRKEHLSTMIEMEGEESIIDLLKTISIKDVI